VSKNLIVSGMLICAIATLASCQRVEDQDHVVCFSPRMDDKPRFWGDVEVRYSPRAEGFLPWGKQIALVWFEAPRLELDRAGIERLKQIAAAIGGNGIILNGSRLGSDEDCLEAHTGRSRVSSGEEPRWYPVRVVDMPQLWRWSPSPFYDPDPHVRFKRVIDEWNEVANVIFELGPEMDWPEDLILAEAMWWDWLGRINTLKGIYRAESDGSGDFDEALRLTFAEASQEVFQDIQQVIRMLQYHEDDEFTEGYTLLHVGLKTLADQFSCETDLWYSRTGR
jgi:hypothetical protein